MSARFPFYYFFFLSVHRGARRTRKISSLASQPFDNSSPAVFDFSLMIADFGYGWLFIPSESFPLKQAAASQNSQLFSLGSLYLSSCCSSQCQGHVKSQFALCLVVHPWHVAQLLLLVEKMHLRVMRRKLSQITHENYSTKQVWHTQEHFCLQIHNRRAWSAEQFSRWLFVWALIYLHLSDCIFFFSIHDAFPCVYGNDTEFLCPPSLVRALLCKLSPHPRIGDDFSIMSWVTKDKKQKKAWIIYNSFEIGSFLW